MRHLRLLIVAMFAILAFGAVATAVASAEETEEKNNPRLLVLEKKVTELKFSGTASETSTLSVLKNAERLTDNGKAAAKLEGCLEISGLPLDTTLCHTGLLTFEGVKTAAGVSCRSETLAGVKDALGVVLARIDGHIADEKSTENVLEPLLIAEALGVDGTEKVAPVEIKCGTALNIRVLGKIPCLILPGLKETSSLEILCKTALEGGVPNGDQTTGKCELTATLCKELEENPFRASFDGVTSEMAAMLLHINGTSNIPVYLDD
jgi:hypothetical protein